MKNLTNPMWIKLKGFLFLVLALFSSALLLFEHPTWRTGFLLMVAIWSSCRFYYFVFYVIQRYVDPTYEFAGLVSFARYLISGKLRKKGPSPRSPGT